MRGRPSTCSRVGKKTASKRERSSAGDKRTFALAQDDAPVAFHEITIWRFRDRKLADRCVEREHEFAPSLAKRELRTRVLQRRKGIDCGRRSHQAEQYRRRESTSCLLEENSARSLRLPLRRPGPTFEPYLRPTKYALLRSPAISDLVSSTSSDKGERSSLLGSVCHDQGRFRVTASRHPRRQTGSGLTGNPVINSST